MQQEQNTVEEYKVSTPGSPNEISIPSPNNNSYEQCSKHSLLDVNVDQVHTKPKRRRNTESEKSLIVSE